MKLLLLLVLNIVQHSLIAFMGSSPLDFQKFNVIEAGNRMYIQWQVTNQVEDYHFEIEKSIDDNNSFRVIAVALPYENNSDSCYEYRERISRHRNSKVIHYRIHYCDKQGNGSYSPVVSVR